MTDVVIIGAGPVGLACGISAKRMGLKAKIIEKGALVNSLVGYPVNMEFFSTSELLEIGDHPFPTRGAKPTREEGIAYYQKVAFAEELDLHLYERVLSIEGGDEAFQVVSEKATYSCRKVVMVTGFFDVPNSLQVPGSHLPKVSHYFREPYGYTGQKVAVIGAKNSAAKAALRCHRAGAEVTLVIRGPGISEKVKYWIKPDLENRIKEGGINAYYQSHVVEIKENALVINTPEGTKEIDNDWVLAMTGYRPDFSFLRNAGVEIEDNENLTPVHDPNTFETSRPGLYLAGTVCGGLHTSRWFIENGRFHAKMIMQHIATGIAGDITSIPTPVAENIQ